MSNRLLATLAVALTCFTCTFVLPAPAAAQARAAQNDKSPRLLPVYVQVDKRGLLTAVEPAVKLDPALGKLLKQTLGRMITTPAHDAKGQPIDSQFIITLAMQTARQTNGTIQASFAYRSAKPVPDGVWHWVHSGDKYALARKGMDMHDMLNHSSSCVADMGVGAGHRKTYILNGIMQGTEPMGWAGKCFSSQH